MPRKFKSSSMSIYRFFAKLCMSFTDSIPSASNIEILSMLLNLFRNSSPSRSIIASDLKNCFAITTSDVYELLACKNFYDTFVLNIPIYAFLILCLLTSDQSGI